MCLHEILLSSLKRKKPAKHKVHIAAILKSFNEALSAAKLSIIFLMTSVLIGSFFTIGLPFALFRRLDNILGTRAIKQIWAVNRNKRVEPIRPEPSMTYVGWRRGLDKSTPIDHDLSGGQLPRPGSEDNLEEIEKDLFLSFFNTASNNNGISCSSVFGCQALDSHS